jgi:hypothetical protein
MENNDPIEKSKRNPIGVYLSNGHNLTTFTRCCGAIVDLEQNCPICGLYVTGWNEPIEKRAWVRFNKAKRFSRD